MVRHRPEVLILPKPPPQPPTPSCPRCGYDLSGAIASWTHTCPLSTTCSECGLLFELRLTLNPRLFDQVQFFEVSQRRTFKNFRLTLRRALSPFRFWSWVAMEHRPNLTAMFWSVLLMTLSVQLLCSLLILLLSSLILGLEIAMSWGVRSFSPSDIPWSELPNFILAPWFSDGPVPAISPSVLLLDLLFLLFIPLTFVLLPDTLRVARVKRTHILRIAAWSVVAVPLLLNLFPILWLVGGILDSLARLLEVDVLLTGFASSASSLWHEWERLAFTTLATGWLFAWWGIALSRYLKLPVPWFITLCLSTIAFLAALLICILIPETGFDLLTHI